MNRLAHGMVLVSTITLAFWTLPVWAHPGHEHDHESEHAAPAGLRTWKDAGGVFELQAAFVATREGNVQLRKPDGRLVTLPIERLSHEDQHWLEDRQAEIRQLNQRPSDGELLALAPPPGEAGRDDSEIARAFEPFAKLKAVRYRSDDRYFYVESNGIPDHPMMVGITAWQQQVPLPQKYVGANAWQIPLHPVPAKEPASAKGRFLRGAIAVAVNGIPIFNPLNNRGDDAYLFGELDEYGGHCGRADDYHYHLAPVHLEKQVGKGSIIGYALDGYPIYGYDEPDGKKVVGLDWLNGHEDADGHYHYHATKTYPYLNGGFYGEIVERDGQVDPQPRAEGVREALPPLRGAKIVGFSEDKPNSYLLTYEISGRTGTVAYTINGDGTVAFRFTDTSGRETNETYQPRRRPPGGGGGGGGGGKDRRPPRPGGNPPPKDGPPPPRRETSNAAPASRRPQSDLPQLAVTSPAVGADEKLPAEFTCDGARISPPVAWSGAPPETRFYALSLWHTAPDQEKSYWVVYNIPAKVTSLEKNSQAVGETGINDMRRTAYEPMCSKGPGVKTYHITVYALEAELKLAPHQASRARLLEAIQGITLAQGTLDFHYERAKQE